MKFTLETWLQHGAILGKVGKWVEVFWGSPEHKERESDLKTTAIYRTSFFRESTHPWSVFPKSQRFEWKEWRSFIQDNTPAVPVGVSPLKWQEPLKEDFKKTFADIRKDLVAKRIIKAVPAVYAKAPKTRPLVEAVTYALRQSPKNTYIYGMWSPQVGFLGFTPEILFISEKAGKIKTMALAGTRKVDIYQLDPEEFVRDPKELREHNIVVDDITERLKPLGKVRVGKTATLELDHLAHLYTPVQVSTSEAPSFEKMVEALHPTPALGVSPRNQIALLRKWRDPNSLLGAPFGVRWSDDNFLSVVAIRQLSWDEKFYYIGNGCGVVEESKFEDEWQELKLKRESVRKMFKL